MKKIILASLVSLGTLSALATPAGDLNLNANLLKIKVYRMAVSTSANCASPRVVIDNGEGLEVDVKGSNPSFGAGRIDPGTYPCILIEMSDTIKYSGDHSSSGNCRPDKVISRNLCHNGDISINIDGTTHNCTNGEDKIVLYISTNTTNGANGNASQPPMAPNAQEGIYLNSAMLMGDSGSGQLSVFTDGYLCDKASNTGSDCDGTGTDTDPDSACRLTGAEFRYHNL